MVPGEERPDVISAILVANRLRELVGPVVILWAHNRKITYEYTGDQPDTLPYCAIPRGSVIVDPWRKLPDIEGLTVVHYGNTRKK